MTSPPHAPRTAAGVDADDAETGASATATGAASPPPHDATATDAAASSSNIVTNFVTNFATLGFVRAVVVVRHHPGGDGDGGDRAGQRWGLARRDRGRNRSEMADEDVSGAIPGDVLYDARRV